MSKAYLERLGGHERDVDEAIIHEVANQAEQIVLASVLELLLAQRAHHLYCSNKKYTVSAKVNTHAQTHTAKEGRNIIERGRKKD